MSRDFLDSTHVSRRQLLGVAGGGLLATHLPGCGGSVSVVPSYVNTIDWAKKAIAQVMGEQVDAAAISVALLKRDTIVWQQAFGTASAKGSKPATTRTRFNIGSVSKVLAGLTGVILQDRKLIDLDTPITRYLPAFKMLSPEYERITSRHLLSHSSGLPGTNGRNLFSFAPIPGYSADTEGELANAHLKHSPGQLAVYCNDGFTMFEQVVLAVTGQHYPDFVEENILKPLKMTNSSFLRSPNPEGDFAYPRFEGKQTPLEFVNAFATGGLSSTPSDMMNLARMFLGAGVFQGVRIVSAAGIAAMATDQTKNLQINPSPEWRWGLGWDSVRQPGLAHANIFAWEKNGGTAFFSTEFFVLPDAQMGLLLTGNAAYGGKALAIAEGILLRALQEEGALAALPPTVVNTVPAQATPANLAAAAGIYGNYKAPMQVAFGADASLTLHQWDGQAWASLYKDAPRFHFRSDGWWWSDNGSLPSFRFTEESGTDDSGKAYRYRYLIQRVVPGAGLGRITLPIGQQLAPLPKISAAWQARLKSKWSPTNESRESVSWTVTDDMTVSVSTLAELPGYILFGGADMGYQLLTPLADDRAGPSVKISVNHGRDLNEVSFSTLNGVQVLKTGSLIYKLA
ncbi:serine hydrolase domain-containing protein [Ottowia thiooxydans]|uniref:serine hydrolase domain-containing protein n=1 Tax=Ottowia thiooxydans TaxID=219182 RepID=UPI0004258F51|nr:serine hydrolase domain-containing protein [Ottowia thiooxydans]